MRTAAIPGTDLQVSQISLGTAALGTLVSEADSFALLDAFVAAGGTLIDTAHIYADWHSGERSMSEKTIGRWLRRAGRDRVVLVTKGGHPEVATPLAPRLAPAQIVGDLDESLRFLGVDQIDLYYLHRDEPGRDVGEIMETLNAQVRAGKVRQIGCSNWSVERIRAAQAYAAAHGLRPFVASQIYWSLAVANPGTFSPDHAQMDAETLAYHTESGLAAAAFTSQARGFFTRVAAGGLDALKPDRRRDFASPTNLARLARAQSLAKELGASISAVVLAYISSHPFVGIPIVGPLTQEQLRDSLSGADLRLTPEQLRFLTADDPVA